MKKRTFKTFLSLILALSLGISSVSVFANGTVDNEFGSADVTPISSSSTQKRNIMYYGDWSIWGGQGEFYPDQMPADKYTHLNFAFLDFDAAGNLHFTDKDAATGASLDQPGVTWGDVNGGILPALRTLRATNPNMKIGISVGGWSMSGDFTEMTASDTARANFVENICKYVEYTGMDFVDIDWEYPTSVRAPDTVDNSLDEGTINSVPADKENYIKLLSDLRVALDAQGEELGKSYELSVALPISQTLLANGVDVSAMFEIIDFANMMTYDARGAWDSVTGHQTPLYGNPADPHYDAGFSIDQCVDYMLAEGAPSEKIVVGSAWYTRGWGNVVDESPVVTNPGLFSVAEIAGLDADQTPSRGALHDGTMAVGAAGRRTGSWAYRNLDLLKAEYPGLVEYWDDVAKAPYLYGETDGIHQFFTYDNARSIEAKTQYVHDNDLGGMITWMASNDDTTNSDVRDELTTVMANGLYGNVALPDLDVVETPLDIEVTVNEFNESWSGSGYEITIKNNEKTVESGNEVLQLTEAQHKSIVLPKLYIDNSGIPLIKGDSNSGTITNENGMTVIDMASNYTNKLLKPGASITFKLKQDAGTDLDMYNLLSIEMTQRTLETGTEMRNQVIYGGTGDRPITEPTIVGAKDKTISVGDQFDSLAGVTATDRKDGDLTDSIVVVGEVDTAIEGEYELVYSVVNSENLTTEVIRLITVASEPDEDILVWSRSAEAQGVYVKGIVVIHNGIVYEQVSNGTVWWCEPGTNDNIWQPQ